MSEKHRSPCLVDTIDLVASYFLHTEDRFVAQILLPNYLSLFTESKQLFVSWSTVRKQARNGVETTRIQLSIDSSADWTMFSVLESSENRKMTTSLAS